MDYAISLMATKLLTDGVTSSYPCTTPGLDLEDRFYVHLANYNSTEYIIDDLDLELFPHLPISLLEDPSFDLVSWYWHYINNFGKFKSQYINAYCGPRNPESICSNHSIHPLETCTFTLAEPSLNDEGQPDIAFEIEDPENYVHAVHGLQRLPDTKDEHGDGEVYPAEDELLGNLDNDQLGSVGDALIHQLKAILMRCQLYPGDDHPVDPTYQEDKPRFIVESQDFDMYLIYDRVQGLTPIFTLLVCIGVPSLLGNGLWRSVPDKMSFPVLGNMCIAG